MKSKPIDAGVVPKLWLEGSYGSALLPATYVNLVTLKFRLMKPVIVRIGHYINCHRDNSASSIAGWRQVLLDGVQLYSQVEFDVTTVPFGHLFCSGERIKSLSSGDHTVAFNAMGTVANIMATDEAYLYVQEL